MKVEQAEITDPQSLHSDFTPERAACIVAVDELFKNEGRLRKLRRYAGRLVFGVIGVRQYAEAGDLLNESVLRTLDGRRKWKPERVVFDAHLKGCMRSIASQHGKEAARYSREQTPVEPSSQEHRVDMLIFDKTRFRLNGDKTASAVLELLLESHSPAEIREMLTINVAVYNAARKRISRAMREVSSPWKPVPKPTRRQRAESHPQTIYFRTSTRGEASHSQAH